MNSSLPQYSVTVEDEEFMLTSQETNALDILALDDGKFHLLKKDIAYDVAVLNSDFTNKTLSVSVNGNTYAVTIADEYDHMVKKMGLLINSSQKVNEIKAPMPGLILDIMVKVGQEILEGTPLLVLSAMKMENIILAQGDGIIKSIAVKKNDAVEKGQLIIEME